VRFWKKKEEKKERAFMIVCEKCRWNFTDEYIKNNTDGNVVGLSYGWMKWR